MCCNQIEEECTLSKALFQTSSGKAQTERSLREKNHLNCIQILKERFTIGFEVHLDIGSKRGGLEQSKEYRDVWQQDEFSNCNHLSLNEDSFQYSIVLMLAAQE